MQTFLGMAKEAELEMSDKSTILASKPMLSRVLSRVAEAKGVKVKTSAVATDLGLDVSARPHRHLHHARKRIAKAMRRDGRVRKLQLKRARARVFNTAVVPAATYTAAALGGGPIQRWLSLGQLLLATWAERLACAAQASLPWWGLMATQRSSCLASCWTCS